MTFDLVHRDERLLVLDKPSGLLAVPGRGPDLQDCLSARVQAAFPTALIVHRLDRDTSGLMLMALDLDAQRELNRQFAERLVEKKYVAVAFGDLADESGLIDLPMRKDFDRPPRHRIDHEHGKPAHTEWRTLARFGDRTRLELRPLTGRSHQLRLHLATLGHPILGDNLYAHPEALAASSRLLLHAEELTLFHPDDQRRCTWRVPTPF